MSKYVISLDNVSKRDISLVGGKGANLGEMIEAGFPVPSGFAVTTEAFTYFLSSNRLNEYINNELAGLGLSETVKIATVGEKIRKTIVQGFIVPEIADAIIDVLETKGKTESPFAVRSSATAEDLASASFAGQQDTYLNVIGKEAILNAVRSCWASLYTDRAIIYRIKNNFEHDKVFISVIVQELIRSKISGIMFTADPVSQNRNRVSIDASYGLGEALVSGVVSADNYIVNSETSEIIEKTIGSKKIKIASNDEGGTAVISLSQDDRDSYALNDEQIIQLIQLGKSIESHYGKPQDIEWCMTDEVFFILQSRPITTLFPRASSPTWNKRHFYISFGRVQNMMLAFTPLGVSAIRTFIPVGKNHSNEESYYASYIGGHIYIDLTDLLTGFPIARKLVPRFLSVVDQVMHDSVMELLSREEFQPQMKLGFKWAMVKRFFNLLFPILRKVPGSIFWRDNSNDRIDFETKLDKVFRENQLLLENASVGYDRIQVSREILGKVLSHLKNDGMSRILTGTFSLILLKKWCHSPELDEHFKNIESGIGGNITTTMDLAVGDLADLVAMCPEIKQLQGYKSADDFINMLDTVEGTDEFKAAFKQFIECYGFRANGEIDIGNERWSENPASLLTTVFGGGEKREIGGHRKHYEEKQRRSLESEKVIIQVANKIGGKAKKYAAKLLANYRNCFCIREHPKYYWMKHIGLIKKYIIEDASELVNKGIIEHSRDIIFLFWDEIESAYNKDDSLKDLVTKRKLDHEYYRSLNAPAVLTDEGEVIAVIKSAENIPDGALSGSGVSAGVVEGYARVVLDPSKEEIHEGEILIAPFTDPGWTPLFIHAKGLVMEVGGKLTHGAVVAREYGIPAVVCVLDATKKIKTGQKIRVNGSEGIIEFID